MEILAGADNISKMSAERVKVADQIALQMLANSDEKVQKSAVDILGKLDRGYVNHNLKTLQNLTVKAQSKNTLSELDLNAVAESERSVSWLSLY